MPLVEKLETSPENRARARPPGKCVFLMIVVDSRATECETAKRKRGTVNQKRGSRMPRLPQWVQVDRG